VDTRNLRRKAKNGLNRLPVPVRDRVAAVSLRGYEWYVAFRSNNDEPEEVDGLPVPPPGLRVKVVGHTDLLLFMIAGKLENDIVRQALERVGGSKGKGPVRVLDWGCGCGRVLRWWKDMPDAEIHGCDYDPQLVEWVDRNLDFAAAEVNELSPPLPYGGESFDFVYAISIFTHLTDELVAAWMREIHRVLAPGGSFFFTTHGESYRDRLNPEELGRFDAGESVVQFASTEGSNLCAAFSPRPWVESRLLEGFELVELQQHHELDDPETAPLAQDRWLIRKLGPEPAT
jgi:SAM-dependent methyltransferase